MSSVKLPATVSSSEDLASLVLEIRQYATWFAANAIKHRVHAKNATPPPQLSPGAMELVRSASGTKLLNQQMLDTLIGGLEAAATSAPTVTVTLAAPAAKDVKAKLVGAIRATVAENALVTFKFNSSLCGGMVIAYGSRVVDWSFRRQILDTRSRFPEVLRRV